MHRFLLFVFCACLFAGCPPGNPPISPDNKPIKPQICIQKDTIYTRLGNNKELEKAVLDQAYYCNEIIVWPDPSNQAGVKNLHKYLDSLGFKKIDSCRCASAMELWSTQSGGPDINLQGVIQGARRKLKSSGDSLSQVGVNYALDLDMSPSPALAAPDAQPNPPSGSIPSIVVGVIDGGVAKDHKLLKDYLWKNPSVTPKCDHWLGWDVANPGSEPTDMNGHGSHVEGIISGGAWGEWDTIVIPGGKPLPVGSVTFHPRIELLTVKITRDSSNKGSLFQAICGMVYAVNKGAKILNLSWGFRSKEKPGLLVKFAEMVKDSVLMVAAAGNEGVNTDIDTLCWPAGLTMYFDNVISVGAYSKTPSIGYATFTKSAGASNRGNKSVDVLAPGVQIWSAFYGDPNQIAQADGTSMAAPFVTRTAAFIKASRPNLTPGEIKRRLRRDPTPLAVKYPEGLLSIRMHRPVESFLP